MKLSGAPYTVSAPDTTSTALTHRQQRRRRGVRFAEPREMRLIAVSLSVAFACHGSSNTTSPDASASIDGAAGPDASNVGPVTFSYSPDWDGVVSVAVVGGFGQSTDWTAPFVTLAQGSDGSFAGSAMIGPGTYPYLFYVVGDAAAGAGSATFARYSLDGSVAEFAACPGGPTMAVDPTNPCSLVTVPQAAAEPAFTIKGSVELGGSAAAKYLVMLERDETGSHHYFVNRRATGSGGSYMFDVAAGTYRVQVLHASYFAEKDSQIDPETVDTVRRDISDPFAVAADFTVSPADVTPPDYTKFEPRTTSTLPTTFTFPSGPATKLDVYGSGAEIGDPWFTSTPATTTASTTTSSSTTATS